jgi:hypothetical protein
VQAADDGDVLDLGLGELPVGAVDGGEDVARVDEQDLVVGSWPLSKNHRVAGRVTV